MDLNTIKGLGPKTKDLLNKLNIFDIEELLSYYPYRYNFIKIRDINTTSDETIITIGKVHSIPKVNYIKKYLNTLTFQCLINNLIVKVIIFNRPFLKNNLSLGKDITLIGKYNKKSNTFTANNIKLQIIKDNSIESVYHLINGLKQKKINELINNALNTNLELIDYIPEYLNKSYNLIDKKLAIKNIHQPSNINLLKKSKLKLIYEEFFIFLFKINFLKQNNKINNKGIKKKFDHKTIEEFINSLPFELTQDQKLAIDEITTDLASESIMNRLLLGDVGSGKTVVAVATIYANYLAGFQSAMMVPTEILAFQHFFNISSLLANRGMNIEILTGSLTPKEKKIIINNLKDKKIDLIIGTHALISDTVEFNNLGLVITDEQHRFGVHQRKNLQNKGEKPDILYMSATPIPRTYALTLYGDMDITTIKEKPKNRLDVKTVVKKENQLKEVLISIYEEIKKGHQIYIVSPLIEEQEEGNNLKDVNTLLKKFKEAFPRNININILHGKQKNEEKDKIMKDFKNHLIDILISTTVIEVGVDIKDATTIVIFNAERFGLATLHQLRGRVGRNDLESFCYLISNYDIKRLKVLEESNDGFYISEKDYELRGEGDIFGTRQSGDMSFKIATLPRDIKILSQAQNDVQKFIDLNIKNNFINYPIYKEIINKINP